MRATTETETKLLAARVRAGDPKAIGTVAAALKRHEGNRTATAKALGVPLRTLYNWAYEVPELAKLLGLEVEAPAEPMPAELLAAKLRAKNKAAIGKVATTLRRHHGNVSQAAEALGVARSMLYEWANQVPELAKLLAELSRGRGAQTLLTYQGQQYRLGELAKKLGIGRSTLSMRLAAGKTVEEAVATGGAAKPAARATKKRQAPTT